LIQCRSGDQSATPGEASPAWRLSVFACLRGIRFRVLRVLRGFVFVVSDQAH
jgi:hypothetical protein